MNFSNLFEVGNPIFYITSLDSPSLFELHVTLSRQNRNSVIRTIRGAKCRNTSRFFDEIGAALQFPYYFGENWAAFNDCITDMTWLPGEQYLLIVTNAPVFLADSPEQDFSIFLEIIRDANFAPYGGEDMAIIRVVFQCTESERTDFEMRLARAGAQHSVWDIP